MVQQRKRLRQQNNQGTHTRQRSLEDEDIEIKKVEENLREHRREAVAAFNHYRRCLQHADSQYCDVRNAKNNLTDAFVKNYMTEGLSMMQLNNFLMFRLRFGWTYAVIVSKMRNFHIEISHLSVVLHTISAV